MRRRAPAKLNLGLELGERLPGGLHRIATLMVPISLADWVEVEPAGQLQLQLTGPVAVGGGADNLVWRAAQSYLSRLGGGAKLTLEKRIPLGSGLGGGSSDAAATLLALQELFPSQLDLAGLAARLGADVPFFLLGGAAIARGFGEQLQPVSLPQRQVVVVRPDAAVSTAEAYRWWDESGGPGRRGDFERLIAQLRAGEVPDSFNAFQELVASRCPPVAQALSALRGSGLGGALMSGSGSSCFAYAGSRAQAEEVAAQLAERFPRWWVQAAEF